jgi:hypothetical protein
MTYLGIAVAAIVLVIVVAFMAMVIGTDDPPKDTPAVSKRSFCSYASQTNGSGLLELASNEKDLKIATIVAEGYMPAAPKAVEPALQQLVVGIKAMKGQQVPRIASPKTIDAATRVDAYVTANCPGGVS